MSSRVLAVSTLLARFLWPAVVWADSSWFPFAPSGLVSAGSAVDASGLLVDHVGDDVSTSIAARGHLRASSNGHFYFENTGLRARFFGVNLMSNTMFPPTADAPQQPGEYTGIVPLQAADQLAIRLAQLGVNMVRLHFIDGAYARPVSIWDPHFPNDTLHFDPMQVSRLDYLIYRLKAHGIYCDVNLHAGRVFRNQDGIADFGLFAPLSYNKPATQFDPAMIALQQQYASALLTHRNPYTGLKLSEDPAVAFVEISNEDSMMYSYANDQLKPLASNAQCQQGMACGLPASYSSQLDQRWNSWLLNKYGSDMVLQAAWMPAAPVNAVQNSLFAADLSNWTLRYFNNAQASVTYDLSMAQPAARIDITQVSGQLWGVQLDQSSLSLQNGQVYDLSITFKGTSGESLGVDLIEDESPFAFYQTVGTFDASSDWQTVQTTFRGAATNSGHVQINLNLGAVPGTVWVGKVTLAPHVVLGVATAESLASQSVARQATPAIGNFAVTRNQDLANFYYDIQKSYFDAMRNYLQMNLGVKSMITATAALGLPLNVDLASRQDFVDEHYYFDYPSLLDSDSSVSNWTIKNTAFTSNPLFLLFNVASLAIQGKPFTLSESGEPFPNDYQSEWLPWATTFGNFQDWDAIMPNSFVNWPDNYFGQIPPGWTGNYFFGLSNNVIALSQFPVASRIFLGAQNSTAAQQTILNANRTDLFQGVPSTVSGLFFGANGVASWLGLIHSFRTSVSDNPSTRVTYAGDAPAVVTSDQGELQYNQGEPKNPFYSVDSLNLQSITGFIAGKTVDLKYLSVGFASDSAAFASISLQTLDQQPFATSGRLLLSVLTRYENTGMVWNASRTSVGSNWGTTPSLIEPLTATYTFRLPPSKRYQIYALNAQGERVKLVAAGSGVFSATLDTGADATVWYELTSTAPRVRPIRPSLPQR